MKKILIILTVLLATVNLNAKDMIKLKFNKCEVFGDKDTVGTVVKAEFNVFVSDDYMKVRCNKYEGMSLFNHDFDVLQLRFQEGTAFYVEFMYHSFGGTAQYRDGVLYVTYIMRKSSYSYVYSN